LSVWRSGIYPFNLLTLWERLLLFRLACLGLTHGVNLATRKLWKLVLSLFYSSLYNSWNLAELLHISLQTIYNNISVLDSSVDPPDTAASECSGSPAVEKGNWRVNNHSPKPCLHKSLVNWYYTIRTSCSSSKNFISVKPAYSFNKKINTEAAAQKRKHSYIKTVTITTRSTNLFYYTIYKITFTPS
jgi:hypothetical protein